MSSQSDIFAAHDRGFFGHPRGLAYLAFVEGWERFSFSGMQALLVLYMVSHLFTPGEVEHVVGFAGFRALLEGVYGPMEPQPLSSIIFGLYTSLIFFLPLFGGYLGDRVFGQYVTVMAGAISMAIGHFLMAFEASFLFALTFLILGAGCLKGNISNQVGNMYGDTDRRRGDAFQVFSAGTNTGVILAPLVCGTLGEVFGWHYGFGAAGVGMLIGLIIYIAGRKYLPPDRLVAKAGPRVTAVRIERPMILLLILVFVLTTCFLVSAGQLGNVYNLWIRTYVDRGIFGSTVPITWVHVLTPLFSVLLTPVVLKHWQTRADRGVEPGPLSKMGFGLLAAAAGMWCLAAFAAIRQAGGAIQIEWLVLTHILIAIGYLYVYPVALALFSAAAPKGARATFIGIFFLTSFVASNLVGWSGGFYSRFTPTAFWTLQGAVAAAGAVLAAVLGGAAAAATPRPTGRRGSGS